MGSSRITVNAKKKKTSSNATKASSAPQIKRVTQQQGPPMLNLISCRVEVGLDDGTVMTGRLLSFDRQQNIVLSDAERSRQVKGKPEKVIREHVGLIFLRGSSVVSVGYRAGITTSSVVIDSRTDGKAAEARRLAVRRTGATV